MIRFASDPVNATGVQATSDRGGEDVAPDSAPSNVPNSDSRGTTAATSPLALRRIDPLRNMSRFYVMALEPTLFGDVALVRQWGRIGTLGRHRIDLHPTPAGARKALERLAKAKWAKGYR